MAEAIKGQHEPDLSETTPCFGERIQWHCDDLEDAGVSSEAIVMSAYTESWNRRLHEQYKAEEPEGMTLMTWATQELGKAVCYDGFPRQS